MKRFAQIMLIGCALSTQVCAQMSAVSIRGQVVDKSQIPIAFANVDLADKGLGTATDMAGNFTLSGLGQGDYSITVSAVGFEMYTELVIVSSGESTTLKITLADARYSIPQIEVLGVRNSSLQQLPGSAAKIDQREMNLLAPVSGNEVFRRVTGVHVVDEEGAGLRTNTGIRGLNPDRSRSVLVPEDGVPVTLNPHGEPEMYYTLAMERMAGAEVVKGAGQIAYGPRTIGGVVNYITADPPADEEVNVTLQGGQGGYFSGLMSYSNTYGNTGVQVSYLRKQADDIVGTSFRLNDLTAKFRFELSEKSSLGLKLGVYNEASNSTYVGLTQTMYDAGGQDFVRMAPDDRLDLSRNSLCATHRVRFNANTELRTSVYGYLPPRS